MTPRKRKRGRQRSGPAADEGPFRGAPDQAPPEREPELRETGGEPEAVEAPLAGEAAGEPAEWATPGAADDGHRVAELESERGDENEAENLDEYEDEHEDEDRHETGPWAHESVPHPASAEAVAEHEAETGIEAEVDEASAGDEGLSTYQEPEMSKDRSINGSSDSVISVIAQGTRVSGEVETDGSIRIEGSVDGSIRAGKAVVIGKDGLVEGDVFTQDAVIAGTIRGLLIAESRLELQSTCKIEGDLRARRIQLEEGALLNGTVQMGDFKEGQVRSSLAAAKAGEVDNADPVKFPEGDEAAGAKG